MEDFCGISRKVSFLATELSDDRYTVCGSHKGGGICGQGMCISRQRVARLMRLPHIRGISRRRGFTVTTRRDKRNTPANDLVKRQFRASGPLQTGYSRLLLAVQ